MNHTSPPPTVSADAVAECVLDAFERLPAKRKPRPRTDGAREWVPLSGIVLSHDGQLTCASLGTGMKCLPSSKLSLANGTVLHDWHAEVLAIRAFNRFLVDECRHILSSPQLGSSFVRQRAPHEITKLEHQPFAIRDNVQIHMYCSEAPCGDASMELVMEAQADPTPWTETPPSIPDTLLQSNNGFDSANGIPLLRGRSHFSYLGAVRLKPSRPDAPPTLSKSCTDKLSHAQVTSLLSSLTSLILTPRMAYLSSLVMPSSQYIPTAAARAFGSSGRMSITSSVLGQVPGVEDAGYAFRPFIVMPTEREFCHSRRSILPTQKPLPSNLSAVYTPWFQETLIGGVLQGRKQFDARGASVLCRRSMWRAMLDLAALAAIPRLVEVLSASRYADVKATGKLAIRNDIKQAVRKSVFNSWPTNSHDEWFDLHSDTTA